MAYNINGGTLYPTYTGGYDLSPEEEDLINAAANGRTVANAGPNTSAMLQDLMGRAMYEQSIAEKQYRQRQDDERNQMLAEQDLALQEQAAQNQFGRQSQLVKAGVVGRVAEAAAGAVNPYTGETGGMDTGSLAAELDKILGNGQPANTGIRPASNTITNKKGEVYNPSTGKFEASVQGPSVKLGLKERILARQKEVKAASSTSKPIVEGAPKEANIGGVKVTANKQESGLSKVGGAIGKFLEGSNDQSYPASEFVRVLGDVGIKDKNRILQLAFEQHGEAFANAVLAQMNKK